MRELKTHGSPDFPMTLYRDDLHRYNAIYSRWHWHPELELACGTADAVEYRIGDERVILRKGESVLVNSEILHSVSGCPDTEAKMYTVLFHPTIISRGSDLIYSKYVLPVLKNTALPFLHLTRGKQQWQDDMLDHISALIAHNNAREDGYELAVVSELTALWRLLICAQAHRPAQGNRRQEALDLRIKQMITFIHTHYAAAITLADIAQSANISKSECQRCFVRALGVSPVDYLISRRLEAAAQALRTTTQSVSDIALSCGFNSSSYFTRRFRQMYGNPPLAYRRQAISP